MIKWVKILSKNISIVNEKGGCGKTTTAYNLAQGLYLQGYKVLGIDMDSQGNFSSTWGSNPECIGAFDILMHGETAKDAIQEGEGKFDLISGDRFLKDFAAKTGFDVNFMLHDALLPIEPEYDFIIIDTPPAVATLTTNAMMSSHYVIIPAAPESYSVDGLVQLNESIHAIQLHGVSDRKLRILGILLTRYRKGTRLAGDMAEIIKVVAEKIGTRVFERVIRENMAIKEAQAAKKSVLDYQKYSNGATDYRAFVTEVLADVREDCGGQIRKVKTKKKAGEDAEAEEAAARVIQPEQTEEVND